MTNNLSSKSSNIFTCISCLYETVRKNQYDSHLLTAKHQNTKNTNEKFQKLLLLKLQRLHSSIINILLNWLKEPCIKTVLF